jgi:hypothetical protein
MLRGGVVAANESPLVMALRREEDVVGEAFVAGTAAKVSNTDMLRLRPLLPPLE